MIQRSEAEERFDLVLCDDRNYVTRIVDVGVRYLEAKAGQQLFGSRAYVVPKGSTAYGYRVFRSAVR